MKGIVLGTVLHCVPYGLNENASRFVETAYRMKHTHLENILICFKTKISYFQGFISINCRVLPLAQGRQFEFLSQNEPLATFFS